MVGGGGGRERDQPCHKGAGGHQSIPPWQIYMFHGRTTTTKTKTGMAGYEMAGGLGEAGARRQQRQWQRQHQQRSWQQEKQPITTAGSSARASSNQGNCISLLHTPPPKRRRRVRSSSIYTAPKEMKRISKRKPSGAAEIRKERERELPLAPFISLFHSLHAAPIPSTTYYGIKPRMAQSCLCLYGTCY